MSDRELIAFFKKPSGNLCGRFNHEQLGRDIVIPASEFLGSSISFSLFYLLF